MKRILLFLSALFLLATTQSFASSVGLMSIEELQPLLGTDKTVILDARSGRDWSTSEFKIPGAVRASANEFSSWSADIPKGSKIVLYCA